MIGNMGEVATLTDRLATMPDQMLPRLAQQYKNDAITLSLILGEKTRRERVRNSMKAQAGAQPQPKVNDAVVAGMQQQPQLPEEMGIGALPAPNMQQMADGGIAGYDDNEQLIYHNEPVMRMAEGGVARYQYGGLLENLIYGNITPAERERRERLAQEAEANRRTIRPSTYEEERARNMAQVANEGYTRTDPRALPGMPSPAQQLAQTGPSATGVSALLPGAAPTTAMPSTTPGAATAPAGGGAPAAQKPADIRAQYLKEVGEMAPKTESAEDFMERRKRMLGDEGEALSKQEARLLAEEAAAPREKDQSFWMAVTQAGLAAAAGASPNALKNIAEGFGTGLAGYREALKEFKKAEQERTKALAEIEKSRRAEKRGDVDAALAHQDKSELRLDRHNDRVAAGLSALSGAQISGEYQLQGARIQAGATAAAAARTPAEIQLIERVAKERNIPFTQAMQEVIGARREPVSVEKLRSDWLDPAKRMMIQQDYPNVKTFDDYMLIMGGSAGLGGGGGGGMKLVGVRPGP